MSKNLPFFKPRFQDIYVINIGARSNVLYSKDAEFNVYFKNDNFLQQNVNRIEDICLCVRHSKGMSLSLWPCWEDEKCFSLKPK